MADMNAVDQGSPAGRVKACVHCSNGFLDGRFGQDIECVNGVLIDIDEHHEGWQRDLCYPVAPCHPDFAKQSADENWCSNLADVQRRLSAQTGDA